MSEPWNVENYREEHESNEQWNLRREFLLRYHDNYSEDRLLCLARVFTNIEFMGCRYPKEVMKEVAVLAEEVAKGYRQTKKTKLQRTFVSASDAAEDRAKGVKRKAGIVVGARTSKVPFVPQGHVPDEEAVEVSDSESEKAEKIEKDENTTPGQTEKQNYNNDIYMEYLEDLQQLQCVDIKQFKKSMFNTTFGKLVLVVNAWTTKMQNILSSCTSCGLQIENKYTDGVLSFYINNTLVASATGATKAEARTALQELAWKRLRVECISVLVKEQFVAHGSRIGTNEVTANSTADQFGTPVENNVAIKMMKLMGWKGGGLGADAQGISEPIKPNLQMVNRAGLGHISSDIRQLRSEVWRLMSRYKTSDCLGLDLVFTSEFSKDERSALHNVANKMGLHSKSYGKDDDRFLVVRKKFTPFSLVLDLLERGGNTEKYEVFIPVNKNS